VFLGPPEGNKFLFSNENNLVQASWPSPVIKLLGRGSISTKVGEEHKKGRQILSSFFGPTGLQRVDGTTIGFSWNYIPQS
jgi:cytochrome P450